ncbi:MAG: 2-oxoglutarate and iron-dependent oxygenase domain-containing protein [Pseudomonadota bacterium]
MGYAQAKAVDFDSIPVIDIGPLRKSDSAGKQAVADLLREAAIDVGFFYVRDHGVPSAVIERAQGAAADFFALPDAEKANVAVDRRHRGWLGSGGAKMHDGARPDLKESFNWAFELTDDDPDVSPDKPLLGPNNWPATLPELRVALSAYYDAMLGCGRDLLRGFATALELSESFFVEKYRKPLARGSIIHYPPQPPDLGVEQFGVGPHTDYGCITLLWQDNNGGLQVRNRAGEWIAAPPIPGTFVINIGDLMARWTNDLFASTPHRVVNNTGRERYSMPVFFDPDFDTVIDCRQCRPDQTPRYPTTTAGAHVLSRFNAAFAYRNS